MSLTERDFPMVLRGRLFSFEELEQIRAIIRCLSSQAGICSGRPVTRTTISRQVCIQLDWRRPNGKLKDAACRYVLLRLHRCGLIHLPSPQRRNLNKCSPLKWSWQSEPQLPIVVRGEQFNELRLHMVTAGLGARLWREYIDRYHYLGYRVIVGPQIRYFIRCDQGILGCLAFGGAAWCVKARDQWIGWDHQTRQQNLPYVINNVRFLILPWVQSPNLASMILAQAAKIVPDDWHNLYGYRPVLMETFVNKERFRGRCYQAANWLYVGDTQGRGKMDRFSQYPTTIKAVYLYPLVPNARYLLNSSEISFIKRRI